MMFGNVAPAPLSCTCAAAGAAAQSSPTRAMERVVFTGSILSSGSNLEHELRLNQELIDRRPDALELQAIDVGEHPHVLRQLVRRAADDPGIAIVGDAGVGIDHVHTADEGDLAGWRQVIDAEGANDASGDRRVLHRDELARDGELLRPVGEQPQVPVAVGTGAGNLADTGIPGEPHAADATVVVGGLDTHGDAGLEILAEITRASRVTLPVHERELGVDLLTIPMPVDAHTDIGGRHSAGSAERVAIDRD